MPLNLDFVVVIAVIAKSIVINSCLDQLRLGSNLPSSSVVIILQGYSLAAVTLEIPCNWDFVGDLDLRKAAIIKAITVTLVLILITANFIVATIKLEAISFSFVTCLNSTAIELINADRELVSYLKSYLLTTVIRIKVISVRITIVIIAIITVATAYSSQCFLLSIC